MKEIKILGAIIIAAIIIYVLIKLFTNNSVISTTKNGTSGRSSLGIPKNCLSCVQSFEQDLKALSSIYTPPSQGAPAVTYNWQAFSDRLNKLKDCVS